MAKRRKKTRTHLKGPNNAPKSTAPKSFIIRSGKVSRHVSQLVGEVRHIMEPNTASRLRERKSNRLRDFLTMCGPLGVSHMVLFSQKGAREVKTSRRTGSAAAIKAAEEAVGNINMRVSRTPRGPTVTFRVNKFALCKDIAKAQRRAHAPGGEYHTAPLLVLNNFGSSEKHVKLLVSVFQGLFPPIHVQTMHLSEARRIVLLNYNEESQTIDWRHYLISVRPVGVSRRVRRVIEGSSSHSRGSSKKIPNLASVNDISEYLLGSRSANDENSGFETDASSASEVDSDVDEDGKPRNTINLPEGYVGRGNTRDSQRAVRLREIGPRMELRCVKIEEGIPGAGKEAKNSSGGNEILWHAYVKKSQAETSRQRKALQQKNQERAQRRQEQESNVAKKKAEKESRKGHKGSTEDLDASPQEHNSNAEEDEENDEFAYEDMHADHEAESDLFEEDDVEVNEEDSVADASDDYQDEGEEEDDDSDLSPIEIDEEISDDDSQDEQSYRHHKRAKPIKGHARR